MVNPQLKVTQTDVKDILEKVKVVKNKFGKRCPELEIGECRLERYELDSLVELSAILASSR